MIGAFAVIRWFMCVCVLAAVTFVSVVHADNTIVSAGSNWKYLDDGSDQGIAWRSLEYDDSAWATGPAPLGYGEGDEVTVVGFGGNPESKYITTYFRLVFNAEKISTYKSLKLRLLRDDGAVAYLNGTEIARSNMPTGEINYQTRASTAAAAENEYQVTSVDRASLVSGTNILAVEVHQSSDGSSDLGFDLELIGVTPDGSLNLTRGPYLQQAAPDSMIVRWRTNIASNSVVRFGTNVRNLSRHTIEPKPVTEHIVRLRKLKPGSTYYYSIGSTKRVLAGGNSDYFFRTPPPKGNAQPVRVWVLGDSGTANSSATSVLNSYRKVTGSNYTDVWLMLGDNAYVKGTDREYQLAVFDVFKNFLRQTPLWPTPGNHESFSSDSATQSGPYYEIFSMPKRGEAGGVPSGSEAYYSFDHGNIHFVSLASHRLDNDPDSEMVNWLRRDLARTQNADWLIAFWHHSPHSGGSHNSDIDGSMMEMRQNVLPVLEQAGVDLVLGGHSHSYERSYLIDGHYGRSSTFKRRMIKQSGSGREDSAGGAYTKRSTGLAAHEGTVYAVVGSSGQVSESGRLNHPAMYTASRTHGSFVLDIHGNRLDGTFMDKTGVVLDYFTILKGAGPNPTVELATPTDLAATASSASRVDLTWIDRSSNEKGFQIDRSIDGVTFSQIGTASENAGSRSDTNLSASTKYYYRIRAFNDAGSSMYSDIASATTLSDSDINVTAPTSLTGRALSKGTIVLKWRDNSGNEAGFEVEQSTDGRSFTNLMTTGPNKNMQRVDNLESRATYYYRVRAFQTENNAAAFSGYSNVVEVTVK